MAKEKKKTGNKIVLERVYNVPLRKEFLKASRKKRSKKAISALKQFLSKHMKSDNIVIGRYANMKIWENGIKNPPHHIKILAKKNEEGKVDAELEGAPVEAPVEPVKKKEEAKTEKKSEKKKAKETETKGAEKETKKSEKTGNDKTVKKDSEAKAEKIEEKQEKTKEAQQQKAKEIQKEEIKELKKEKPKQQAPKEPVKSKNVEEKPNAPKGKSEMTKP